MAEATHTIRQVSGVLVRRARSWLAWRLIEWAERVDPYWLAENAPADLPDIDPVAERMIWRGIMTQLRSKTNGHAGKVDQPAA